MPTGKPRIWAMLGEKRGDNNQVLGLAVALHLPFQVHTLRYNLLRKLPKGIRGPSIASLREDSRRSLQPPWPDLVIAIGHRSVPVVRWIREQSGGRTKLVHLGNPQAAPSLFDLVITTPQYRVPNAENVIRLSLPINLEEPISASPEERAWLDALERPHRLVVVGGRTKMWTMAPDFVAHVVRHLTRRAASEGGVVIGVGSPRTERVVSDAMQRVLNGRYVRGSLPRYRILLNDADEIYVTADSVSMLADAIYTRKPVGFIPIKPTPLGRLRLWLADHNLAPRPARDLRAFWRVLEEEGFVGTVDHPSKGAVVVGQAAGVDAIVRLVRG